MSIVHIVPSIANEASGPTYSVVNLCQSLLLQGKNVQLAVVEFAPLKNRPNFLRSFPLSKGPRQVDKVGRSPAMKRWLMEKSRTGGIRLIHNHGLWMMPNIYCGQVAHKFHIPMIVAPRGTFSHYAFSSGSWLKKPFWTLLQKPALEPTMCFHATGEAEFHDIRRMGYKQPVAIIPNGIDIPPYKRLVNQNTRTLLYLGRIHPEKGLELLLQAWAKVYKTAPAWRLRIVGPDKKDHLRDLKAIAAREGLERIDFDNALYGSAKLEAYRKAELYVLPSPSENFGVSIAEALAAGTPAIATKGAPWPGLVEHDAGWWSSVSVDALTGTLTEALAQSPKTLEEMGQRGRTWVKRDLSWEKIGRETVQLYDWLLEGKKRPSFIRDGSI